MNKLNTISKVLIVAGVVAVLIILTIVYTPGSGQPSTTSTSTTTLTANSPAQTPAQQTPSSTQPAGTPAPGHLSAPVVKSPTAPVIKIITPVAGDVWQIGSQNSISWSEPGKISGSISLISATTQQFVGIILPQIGPDQTSYTWNTRSISLSRTDPSGKDVTPGTYEIQIAYDGNNIRPVTSPAFTITN